MISFYSQEYVGVIYWQYGLNFQNETNFLMNSIYTNICKKEARKKISIIN